MMISNSRTLKHFSLAIFLFIALSFDLRGQIFSVSIDENVIIIQIQNTNKTKLPFPNIYHRSLLDSVKNGIPLLRRSSYYTKADTLVFEFSKKFTAEELSEIEYSHGPPSTILEAYHKDYELKKRQKLRQCFRIKYSNVKNLKYCILKYENDQFGVPIIRSK